MTPARLPGCLIPPSANGPVAEIDKYSDVLSPQMRAAWPVVASATRRLKGSLVGGTALALTLHHRESYDLDFLAQQTFSGAHLFRKLDNSTDLPCELIKGETESMHADVGGVMVQVFRPEARGSNPGYVKQLHKPTVVDGMRVASLPDLLATKLDVIMYRPKLRDYIDIAAIDAHGRYSIEDGIRFHAERYGVQPHSRSPEEILRLLEDPGRLAEDRVFAAQGPDTLRYLRTRAAEARAWLGTWRDSATGLDSDTTTDYLAASRAKQRCGAEMPVARAYCCLSKGHRGHHRSR